MSEDFADRPPPVVPPTEDWAERIEQLLAEAEGAPSMAERIEVLCRVAEIYERRVGDPRGALVTLQAALQQDPASGRVILEMERIARGNGRWTDLVAITAEVAGALEDRKQAADLWVQIAFWHESGLAMFEDAADAARAALALEPAHGGALALLENVYRRMRSWDRLVEILDTKRTLPGSDPYRLAEAYREVLRYEPQHRPALEGLSRLYEDGGQWTEAAETLRKLVAVLAGDEAVVPARVEALYRLGAILREHLADARGAEEQLVELLALPGGHAHVPGMLQLAAIYRERRDWLKARQLIGRAAALVQDPQHRTRLLVDAAEICARELDDEPQAATLYAEALALEETRADIVERLADIRFRRGDWAGLLPLAARLVDAGEAFAARPAEEQARLRYQLARAAEETGDEARALDGYRAAVEAAPTGAAALGARRGLAALTFRREAWAEAAAAYEALLAHGAGSAEEGGGALRRDERLEALERQGIALLRAGEPARAIEPLERALALEPRHRRALEAVVEAGKAASDDEVVVRHSQVLLNVMEDPSAKRELLEALATIHRERRNDPQRAIAAYRAALDLWPDERSIMHRLLELLSETKQWKQAVQLLARLAELTEAEHRAPYWVAAGNILVEELGAGAEAIEAYDRALDADPSDLKTFERIERLVTEARDWKTQERAYRRQIKRMGPEAAHDPTRRPALLALWNGLGEIYRSRLKDLPAAIAAFEVAAGLDPGATERRRALAELYRLAGPDTYAKAIAEHRTLVQRAATVGEMAPDVRMMLRLFVEQGALDEAHACAAVLVLAGKADADERALYDQYRPRGVVRAHGRLTEELWQRLVYHPDEDRALSQLLATLSPAVSLARAKPPKELGLKKKQQHDVLKDQSVICRALAYGVAVFGVPVPDVFLVPESPGELDVANLRRTIPGVPVLTPALVVGGKLLATTSDLELAFTVGRVLAAIRPDHVLRWPSFVPTLAELAIVAQAAVHICDRERPLPPDEAQAVAQYAAFVDRTLPPQMVEQLSALVRRSRIGRDSEGGVTSIDFARWSRGAFLTTIRAGFLLAGDLEGAVHLGQTAAVGAGVDPIEVTRDLAAWSVSEAYFDLRAELGLRTVNLGFRG